MKANEGSDKVISKWTVGTDCYRDGRVQVCAAIFKGEGLTLGERRRTRLVFFPLGEHDTDYTVPIMVGEAPKTNDGLVDADGFRVIDEIIVPIPENISKDGYSMLYRVYLEASLELNEEVRVSIKYAFSDKTLTTRVYNDEQMRTLDID